MIQCVTDRSSWEEHTKMFVVNIFPSKNPNKPYVNMDEDGNTYDTYLVFDSYKTWRLGKDWRRIIKASGGDGYYTINTKRAYKTLDQYDKDVVDYINTNYSLPADQP
jgi:hypothetical protein